jgi:hypothetical protein
MDPELDPDNLKHVSLPAAFQSVFPFLFVS